MLKSNLKSNPDTKKLICEWLAGFMARANPALGRPGAVCPYVPSALGQNAISIEIVDGTVAEQDIKRIIIDAAKNLLERMKDQPQLRPLHVAVIAFPDVDCAAIDRVQDHLKGCFVSQGLMLGEFHPKHQGSGLHNPNFKPMQAPVPMLVVREMVRQDRVFLTDARRYSAERIQHFFASYDRFFPAENKVAVEEST